MRLREPTSATGWAIIPHPRMRAFLAMERGRGWGLPEVTFVSHVVPTDTSMTDALEAMLGVKTRIVRTIASSL